MGMLNDIGFEDIKRDTREVERLAWEQLDTLLHTQSYDGLETFEAGGHVVADPWVREDAQLAEPWPDRYGRFAVDDPWSHYGDDVVDGFCRGMLKCKGMLNLSWVQPGDYVKYVGKGWAFDGEYEVIRACDTFKDPKMAARAGKRLVIIEFMNNGTPMFFDVAELDEDEWAPNDLPALWESRREGPA